MMGCRSVEAYDKLNAIAEGTFGRVYRAKDRETGQIVALKQIKMGKDVVSWQPGRQEAWRR